MRPTTVALFLVLACCGGASAVQTDPASAPAGAAPPATSHEASAADSTPAPPPAHLPTACADAASDLCTPPGAFVDRLCAKPHTDVALALFGKTPFTRLYLRGKLDELAFEEEVLALRFRAQPKNGIQVGSGAGTFDVLRWDGTCATGVDAEMISRARPSRPKAAHVPWHRLGDRTQDALIAASDAVKRAHSKRGKECMGAMSGDVSAACQKADAVLVDAIVDYVRGGGTVPQPESP